METRKHECDVLICCRWSFTSCDLFTCNVVYNYTETKLSNLSMVISVIQPNQVHSDSQGCDVLPIQVQSTFSNSNMRLNG